MLRYTTKARQSEIETLTDLINKIGTIPGSVLNYTDATRTIHALAELRDLIIKEDQEQEGR